MPIKIIADSYTPEQIAGLGGPDGVNKKLYARAWEEELSPIRDSREWVVQLREQKPQTVQDDCEQKLTFAIHLRYSLANPRDAKHGEVVHGTCMPHASIDRESDPPKATWHGRQFVRTDDGWELC